MDIKKGLVMAFGLLAGSSSFASNVWSYVDATGITHMGNVPMPSTTLEGPLSKAARSGNPTLWPGYAEAKPWLDAAARQLQVDPALITAIAATESGFRTNAVSRKGALGLMQIMPATGLRYGVSHTGPITESPLMQNPELNSFVAARYLADLLRLFNGDIQLAIAAYNAGEGAVLRHGGRIPPFPETQQYVAKVLHLYRVLTVLATLTPSGG